MGIKITRGKSFPIGVDLGCNVLRMAQLRSVQESLELLAAGSAPLSVSADTKGADRMNALTEAMKCVLHNGSFKGKQAIISIPSSEAFIHHIKTPKLQGRSLVDAVRAELANKLPYPIEQAVVRHVVAGDIPGDGEHRQEVVTVSASRTTIENYIEIAHRAKLDVVGVNIASCAILECYSRLFRRSEDMTRSILFLDIESDSTQVVLSHGSRLAFARSLPYGTNSLDEAIGAGLNVPGDEARRLRQVETSAQSINDDATAPLESFLDGPADRLAGEITQCLRYCETVFKSRQAERVIFVGPEAYDKRLCQMIARKLNLPAQVGDPLTRIRRIAGAGLEHGLDRREPQPDWSVAIGLSIGAQAA